MSYGTALALPLPSTAAVLVSYDTCRPSANTNSSIIVVVLWFVVGSHFFLAYRENLARSHKPKQQYYVQVLKYKLSRCKNEVMTWGGGMQYVWHLAD